MEQRKAYPSDLTDEQWEHLEPLLTFKRRGHGAPQRHNRRELLNAIFYVTRNVIPWSALPHDFPPYKTVQDFHRKLTLRGLWTQINDVLRNHTRMQHGRPPEPRKVVMDSQSVKTTEKGGLAE